MLVNGYPANRYEPSTHRASAVTTPERRSLVPNRDARQRHLPETRVRIPLGAFGGSAKRRTCATEPKGSCEKRRVCGAVLSRCCPRNSPLSSSPARGSRSSAAVMGVAGVRCRLRTPEFIRCGRGAVTRESPPPTPAPPASTTARAARTGVDGQVHLAVSRARAREGERSCRALHASDEPGPGLILVIAGRAWLQGSRPRPSRTSPVWSFRAPDANHSRRGSASRPRQRV